jgi:thioredoxin-like negative regulator of GroEL
VRLRLDRDDARAETERLGVDAIPVMIVLAPDGKEIARKVGFQPPEKFLEWVAEVPAPKRAP